MAATVGLGLIKLWPVWLLCHRPRRFKMGDRLRCLSSMQEEEEKDEEGCFGPPRHGVKLSRSPEEVKSGWTQCGHRRAALAGQGRALPASSSAHVWSASGGTCGGRSRCKPWKTRQGREEPECGQIRPASLQNLHTAGLVDSCAVSSAIIAISPSLSQASRPGHVAFESVDLIILRPSALAVPNRASIWCRFGPSSIKLWTS
ncbi:hypothetical protein BC567DRAFT_281949 [Phyllosticta citribraziliensis]